MSVVYLQRALHVNVATGYYRIEKIAPTHILGPVDFGFREACRNNSFCFGGGPFMGSVLPGSNRLIVTGFSPVWGGFYVSTMGGAALPLDDVGINYVALEGCARDWSVLKLRRESSEAIEVSLHPVDVTAIWNDWNGKRGVYALRDYIFEKFGQDYPGGLRILATGPAAMATDMGAIHSSPVVGGKVSDVDTWAGRGGLGSKLVQEHRIVGIIFGGSLIDQDFDDRKLADRYFQMRYHMKMMIKDKQATTKYRYDPQLRTGGTFGVNFYKMQDRLLCFNYRSVFWPRDERLRVWERLIKDHYLAQYNRQTIQTKSFRTCGEPCPAVCKKMRGPFKKDYEPYQAMGPLCGVFDQRAAEKLNRHADAAGFDAIQVGGVIAWIMDLLDEGLLAPQDLGLPAGPVFQAGRFRPVEDSMHNAELGCRIVDLLLQPERFISFEKGAREAAKKLGRFLDPAYIDRLVCVAFGDRGWMVPNQYWVPGMFSPMPIMGKYYEYYGDDFVPPRSLGRLNAERMVRELMLDNCGMCRFHREWAEEILEDIFNRHYGLSVDFYEHHLNLARRINNRNASVFWESERVVDVVAGFLRRKKQDGADRPELDEWLARFEQDKWEAARDFWYEIRKGVDEVLSDRPAAAARNT